MCFEKPQKWWLFEIHVAFRFFFYRINKKALIPKNQGFFLVVTPTGFVTVTEGHDAERARDSIMPRSAAT